MLFIWQQIREAGIGSHISPSLTKFSSHHCKNVHGPKSSKKYWTLKPFGFLSADMLTIGIFYFPRRRFMNPPYKSYLAKTLSTSSGPEEGTSNELLGFLLLLTLERWRTNSQNHAKSEILHLQGASVSDYQVCNPKEPVVPARVPLCVSQTLFQRALLTLKSFVLVSGGVRTSRKFTFSQQGAWQSYS